MMLQSRNHRQLHPLHAILLSFPMALFTSALLADITYLKSTEIQWTNFASWLITGALIFGGFVIIWAAISAFRRRSISSGFPLYLLLLVIMWVSGLINAFQHSRDGWSSVGQMGLMLSIISTLCAIAATWVAHRTQHIEFHSGPGARI